MDKRYDVVGIGNALVDVLAHTDDAFLKEAGVEKGIMQLIDTARAAELYGQMGPAIEVSGGSAANTIAGLAALGHRTAYVGKVKDDQLGAIFAHDMRAQGADYETPLAPADAAFETGRCMVLVTPDGERSMNTYLGASETLHPSDVHEAQVQQAKWVYLEGYRFDGPESHEAFTKAVRACRAAGGRVSVTLSDPFCVERHREAFRDLVRDHIDLLFANEHEMKSLYQTHDLDAALALAAAEIDIVACTLGKDGAYVMAEGKRYHAPSVSTEVVDVTGAGDLFASGFFHGLLTGRDWQVCGQMGCLSAAEIISHLGARPQEDLEALFKRHGL